MLPEKLDATYPLQLGVLVGALLLEVLDLRREAAVLRLHAPRPGASRPLRETRRGGRERVFLSSSVGN